MDATLTFPERAQAIQFARAWSRYSKTGHTIGAGMQNVQVTVCNVQEYDKEWIDAYVKSINEPAPPTGAQTAEG